ncbi:phosphomevalonate kinase [Clostridium amylolyticum]|uniref:phosphomevalonate kinase n=1 Tax=Clostridium amylolyticum TaxID=1121298 RepID=A0A1M6BIN0_9CLOT|nr:phosphomevalonate kinase [Clostridium amylolyticum]SHI48536.1 phosphomevalonate kinase [Clostridium amylolyticum]
MSYSSHEVKVPGKLMIAGEYAVLEPNEKSVVAAVNRYVTVQIEPGEENVLSLPQWGLEAITWEINNEEVQFSIEDLRLGFIRNAFLVAHQLLQEKSVKPQSFKLQIKSELDDASTNKKYGLGSSAAIVTAVISSILTFHSCDKELLNLDTIFKLSAIVHLKTQKSGSGADVAAAVYGGWLEYCAFDGEWVLKELEQGNKLTDIIKKPWPNLLIKPLTPPSSLELVVGWTKEPAATAPMIKKLQNYKEGNLEAYKDFLKESSLAVNKLIKSFEINDYAGAINSLALNGKILRKLGENAGMDIETEKLRKLSSIAQSFGSGKSSGAGGGDCGIAFLKSDNHKEELYRAWEEADILPLDLSVSQRGVSVKSGN